MAETFDDYAVIQLETAAEYMGLEEAIEYLQRQLDAQKGQNATVSLDQSDAVEVYRIIELQGRYQLIIPETGEIREATELIRVLRSLVRDHGYYLRKVR